MPTYEYACTTCGKEFELFQSIKDDALKTCNCGQNGAVRRKIGMGAGLIFKGTGFYETDYKRKSTPPASESSGSSASSESKAAPKSETKPSSSPTPPSS